MTDIHGVESIRAAAEWLEGTTPPENFRLCGRQWILCKGVFPATVTGGTEVFAGLLEPYFSGRFCEVGSGTGVISAWAGIGGAESVLSLDINRNAVHNTTLNATRSGVGAKVVAVASDLFESVDPTDSFDCIFWNSPWNLVDCDVQLSSDLERAICDSGYSLHKRYIEEVQRYLRPGGVALLGTADVADIALLHEIAADVGCNLRVVATERRLEVHRLMTYYLLEIQRNGPKLLDTEHGWG